jgi:CheY-like chemotaxis protein
LKEGKYVKISIIDTGVGIPEKHVSKIFDPFYSTKEVGSGLGLSTSFTIVNKHDGTIQVESEAGVGTTFHLYLPATEKRIEKEETWKTRPGIRQGRVLVIDDEDVVRRSAEKILKRLEFEVVSAADGAEGVRLYEKAMKQKQPFHLVIMDLTIPGGMGGKEATQRLRKVDPGAKVIVSSGYSEDRVFSDFEEYGFCGVLVKPYNTDDMIQVISKVQEL